MHIVYYIDMQLREYFDQSKKTIVAFAHEIGVTRDCVQKYLSGKRKPNDEDVLLRIFKATGGLVTANDFYDLPKKPSRKR